MPKHVGGKVKINMKTKTLCICWLMLLIYKYVNICTEISYVKPVSAELSCLPDFISGKHSKKRTPRNLNSGNSAYLEELPNILANLI
jgi:hypothetical protein